MERPAGIPHDQRRGDRANPHRSDCTGTRCPICDCCQHCSDPCPSCTGCTDRRCDCPRSHRRPDHSDRLADEALVERVRDAMASAVGIPLPLGDLDREGFTVEARAALHVVAESVPDPCQGGEEQHDRHLAVCVPFYEWRDRALRGAE